MARNNSTATNGLDVLLLGYLMFLIAVASALAMAIHGLWQPEQLANPGLAAYTPPPATRLVPSLDRSFDAPTLVAGVESEPSLAFAQAPMVAIPAPVKREADRAVRKKRAEKIQSPQYETGYGSAQPLDWGHRPWF